MLQRQVVIADFNDDGELDLAFAFFSNKTHDAYLDPANEEWAPIARAPKAVVERAATLRMGLHAGGILA